MSQISSRYYGSVDPDNALLTDGSLLLMDVKISLRLQSLQCVGACNVSVTSRNLNFSAGEANILVLEVKISSHFFNLNRIFCASR